MLCKLFEPENTMPDRSRGSSCMLQENLCICDGVKVVTLGRLFDVTLGTVKMYLTKVCKKLGYKGIKTYHFSALWANVNDFDKPTKLVGNNTQTY